jgi:lipopolysaccharide export LptBFGC system permease protein LptF
MDFKRNLVLSFVLGLGGGLGAYALAWGLFTTHQELGMDSRNAFVIAAWTAPIVFVASLLYFAMRNAGRR